MTALLTAIVLKGSILMIAAVVLLALMYRASAATRHFVWMLVVVGLLLMPVLSAALPEWTFVVPISSAETSVAIIPVRAVSTGAIPVTTREPEVGRLSDQSPRAALGGVMPWAV